MTQTPVAVQAAPAAARAPVAVSGSYHRLQRRCSCGAAKSAAEGECEGCKARKIRGLQTRLAVGASDDVFEREADAVGANVMGLSDGEVTQHAPLSIQPVGAAERDSGDEAPPVVDAVLRSPGRALDGDSRAFFEPRFGRDFTQVRVHDDALAACSADAVSAEAYTVGRHIVFASGRHAPRSTAGRALLAHELTHVVQQSAAQPVLRKQDKGKDSATPAQAATPTRAPTKKELQEIEAARGAAAIRAQTALMRVGGIVPPGPAGRGDPQAQMRARARSLAQVMFEWENPNMEQISEIVGSIVSHLASPDVRVAGKGDSECGSRAAYVRGLSPPIVLCPTFFSDTPEQRVRTMIHEAAHLARIGAADLSESYCIFFDCAKSCGGFESADSWAQYIHCLSDQTPDQPEAIEAPSPGAAKARAEAEAAEAKKAATARASKLANIADRVYDAMEGWGTDEEAVYRALQELDRDQKQIDDLATVYAERHHSPLIEDIRDDFSGTELEFALQLLNLGSADKPQSVEDTLFLAPKVAAQRIRDAVQGPGTDEEAIYAALMPFRRNTLDLQRAYQEMFSEDLRDRLEDEMSGSELEYALDLMETPQERYMQEASGWLKRFPAVGFGLPWQNKDWYDARFWTPRYDTQAKEFTLVLYAGKPHEAIDALFHEQGRWHVDCAVFVEVVQLYALRQSLGARRFDQRIGTNMVLRAHRSSAVKTGVLFKRDSPMAAFSAQGPAAPGEVGNAETVLAEAPIGSRVRWTSQLLYDKANNLAGPEVWTIDQQSWPNYQHENTVKLGPDRFGAQGIGGGGRVSRQTIEDELVDITAGQFPNMSKTEIRAGIYVSEVEVFEQPDASEQIEPQAQDSQKGPRP
jgi:hypothetical protein